MSTTAAVVAPSKHSKQESIPIMSPAPLYHKEDKDTLAYEHDRQKAKKTLDRARNKARKALNWRGNNVSIASGGKRSGVNKPRSEEDKNLGGKHENAEARDIAHEYLCAKAPLSAPNQLVYYSGPTPFTEVKLADLVVLAAGDENSRAKKRGAGKGGLDGDFEVVPHMRSVIVLDEKDFAAPDVEEESWECIEDDSAGEEKEVKAKASYAKVAASAK